MKHLKSGRYGSTLLEVALLILLCLAVINVVIGQTRRSRQTLLVKLATMPVGAKVRYICTRTADCYDLFT